MKYWRAKLSGTLGLFLWLSLTALDLHARPTLTLVEPEKQKTCLQSIAQLHPLSSEFARISTRGLNQKGEVAANYLLNLQQAATMFEAWFTEDSPEKDFFDIYSQMHKFITSDEGGIPAYYGYTAPPQVSGEQKTGWFSKLLAKLVESDAYKPGEFRIAYGQKYDENKLFLRFNTLKAAPPESLVQNRWQYQKSDSSKQESTYALKITELETSYEPRYRFHDADLIEFLGPNAWELVAFLRGMHRSMLRLRAQKQDFDETQLLRDLAEYIQLGAMAHPFPSVNFSIIMAQVNAILMHFGYRGVQHENLDYRAMVSHQDEFADYFSRLVKKEQ